MKRLRFRVNCLDFVLDFVLNYSSKNEEIIKLVYLDQ